MQQMELNLLKFRGQVLARYLNLKGYLTSFVLNVLISARQYKMLTSNGWPDDNSNYSPNLNISAT